MMQEALVSRVGLVILGKLGQLVQLDPLVQLDLLDEQDGLDLLVP